VFSVYKQVLWFLKARERNFGGTKLQILQTGGMAGQNMEMNT
jgi:hypothetical protein